MVVNCQANHTRRLRDDGDRHCVCPQDSGYRLCADLYSSAICGHYQRHFFLLGEYGQSNRLTRFECRLAGRQDPLAIRLGLGKFGLAGDTSGLGDFEAIGFSSDGYEAERAHALVGSLEVPGHAAVRVDDLAF